MMASMLTQLVYYVPSLLAHLVAFGVAAFVFRRSRVAALLLAGGTALQLLASVCSYAITGWSMYAYQDLGMAPNEVSLVSTGVGVLASLIRAVGEVGVVAAVAAAAFAYGRPESGGTDAYGFPER